MSQPNYEYSETKWFWIIDEVNGDKEKVVASGIENTKELLPRRRGVIPVVPLKV